MKTTYAILSTVFFVFAFFISSAQTIVGKMYYKQNLSQQQQVYSKMKSTKFALPNYDVFLVRQSSMAGNSLSVGNIQNAEKIAVSKETTDNFGKYVFDNINAGKYAVAVYNKSNKTLDVIDKITVKPKSIEKADSYILQYK